MPSVDGWPPLNVFVCACVWSVSSFGALKSRGCSKCENYFYHESEFAVLFVNPALNIDDNVSPPSAGWVVSIIVDCSL